MDADRFDDFLRALARSSGTSRRDVVRALGGITLGGSLGTWLSLADADAKSKKRKRRKKRKKKKNRCTTNCSGKVCGSNGCDGSCGECTECQTCANGACVNAPNGTACSSGACRLGECRACVPTDVPCGADGQSCCVDEFGYICDGDLVCDLATAECGEASDCGSEDAGCCADGNSLTCDAGLSCTTFGVCVASCGAEGEPCCNETPGCDGILECAVTGVCVPSCGAENQPCCLGPCTGGCDGSLDCVDLTCQQL